MNPPDPDTGTPLRSADFASRWAGLSEVLQDPRTGLASRLLLWDRVRHALHRHQRNGTLFALLYVGVEPADEALAARLAQDLQLGLRATDTAAYAGAGEFAILLEDLHDARGASRVIARIEEGMRRSEVRGVEGGPVAFSAGVVLLSDQHPDPEAVLWEGHTAMRQAQRLGGNRTVHASAVTTESAEE